MENNEVYRQSVAEEPVQEYSSFRYAVGAVLAFFGFSSKTHRASKKRAKLVGDIVTYVVLLFGAFIMIYPFWWMLAGSFAYTAGSTGNTYLNTMVWWPQWSITEVLRNGSDSDIAKIKAGGGILYNYSNLFKSGFSGSDFNKNFSYWRAVGNNLFYSIVPVVVGVITSAMAAFSFAKINWIGRNKVFIFLLAAIMVPWPSIMTAQYVMYKSFGFLNNWAVMVVPGLFGSIMTAFFIRQFLFGLPTSIIEAAKIDGAGYARIFCGFILPLALPAIVAQGLLSFMGCWNNYLASFVYINTASVWINLPHAMYVMATGSSYTNNQGPVIAASVMCVLPVLILFAVFQKMIIGSLMLTGSKE